MKVLMLNGSPRVNGNTAAALEEMCSVFAEEGVETELVQVGNQPVRGCNACGRCKVTGKCVFDDVVNALAAKLKEADGFVVASPVYFASANATLIAVLDRLFYSTGFDKTMKVEAIIVIRPGPVPALEIHLHHRRMGRIRVLPRLVHRFFTPRPLMIRSKTDLKCHCLSLLFSPWSVIFVSTVILQSHLSHKPDLI